MAETSLIAVDQKNNERTQSTGNPTEMTKPDYRMDHKELPRLKRIRLLRLLLLSTVAIACGRASTKDLTPPDRPSRSTATNHGPASKPNKDGWFRSQVLSFQFDRGETGNAWPSETTGGGVGMFDFDNDGDLDLFFPQGGSGTTDVLLENLGDRNFRDVSNEVGLQPRGNGQGVTIGDYDADGDSDVYVTRYGPNTLWRNDAGKFVDVTNEANVGCPLWSLGAAFFDYDRDGDLDLFVANYFDFDPKLAPFARDPQTGAANYGMPSEFEGQPDVLYRNMGNGRFEDVSQAAGIAGKGRGMGVVTSDLDGDGRIDVFVANDAQANAFWHNNGDGTFEDRAESAGLAYNGEGQPEANMGVAIGDTNNDELPDVVVTHFFNEHTTLWRALRTGNPDILFQDQTKNAGIAGDSRPLTGWGVALADFDLDGRLDLITTTGHIRKEPTQKYIYANPPILWQGSSTGTFQNISKDAGAYFQNEWNGRGLAVGDLDNDGDLDIVIVHHHAPAVVLWNEAPRAGRFLQIKLSDQPPNRDADGAKVTIKIGDRTLVREVQGGGSYLSRNDPRIHAGLGSVNSIDQIEVRWPSGTVESVTSAKPNAVIEWTRGEKPKIRVNAP